MTNRQIEISREIRLWVAQVVVPVTIGVNVSSEKAAILKDYLREHDIQFEPSSAFNQIHIECLMTENEADAFNKWIDETL